MHIMLKMKSEISINSQLYIPRNGFKLPLKGNQTVISFKIDNTNTNCLCNDFKVFEDNERNSSQSSSASSDFTYIPDKSITNSSTNNSDCSWYQIKNTLKYFNDIIIDGTSITDSWMKP